MDIIAETTDYLVINKPAGLLVHPTDHHTEPTLIDELVKHYPPIAKVGDDPRRPGLVHRLDRDVSGVMVVAKTQATFEHLKKQFASRNIEKEYVALVSGKLSKDEGEINFVIARSRRGGRMAARPPSQEGREAKTRYEVLKRLANATLVRVFPKTGRTHQIRAHFHAIGHPIVGDPLYRTKAQRRRRDQEIKRSRDQVGRIMLHAARLTFTDLTGILQTFEVAPPPELT